MSSVGVDRVGRRRRVVLCGVGVSCCGVVLIVSVSWFVWWYVRGAIVGIGRVVVRRLLGSSVRRDSVVMSVSLSMLLCRVSRCRGRRVVGGYVVSRSCVVVALCVCNLLRISVVFVFCGAEGSSFRKRF